MINPPLLEDEHFAPLFEKITCLQFYYGNDSLKHLPRIPEDFTLNITEIHASNNLLEDLKYEQLRSQIKVLDIRNNNFKSLRADLILNLLRNTNLLLGGNSWRCECNNLEFFSLLKSLKENINDFDNIRCDNIGKTFNDLETFDLCFETIFIILICGIAVGIIGILFAFFYKYRKDIKIFLYSYGICLWFVKEHDLDRDKSYDAFFCFASPDQQIVEEIIIWLENEENNFKCIVGVRDWEPGEMFSKLAITVKIG